MTYYGMTAEAVEKLQEVLDFITDHPERWDQEVWVKREGSIGYTPETAAACGTAGCVAGWLSMFHGGEAVQHAWRAYRDGTGEVREWHLDMGEFDPESVAKQILTEDAANDESLWWGLTELFDPNNDLETIWEIGDSLADGRLRLPDPEKVRRIDEGEYDEVAYSHARDNETDLVH